MRIASVSKSLTSAAVARLCEEGKLDLDVPVQQYVPEFPQKQFDGQDVSNQCSNILMLILAILFICILTSQDCFSVCFRSL